MTTDLEALTARCEAADAHFLVQLRDRFSIHPADQSDAVRHFLRAA